MRIVRFERRGVSGYGVLAGERVTPVRGLTDTRPTGHPHAVESVRLLVPVESATIVGMAHNTGPEDRRLPPQAFFKPRSTLVAPFEAIRLPHDIGIVEPEAELAVVIGRSARRLSASDAASAVLGWTAANDVTARDLQRDDPLWVRAKSQDTFTPLGPWIETGLPPADTYVHLDVSDAPVSQAQLSDLARGVIDILMYLTSFMTLRAGDVVLTGAPGGSTPIRCGDQVTVSVGGVELRNPVVAETSVSSPTDRSRS